MEFWSRFPAVSSHLVEATCLKTIAEREGKFSCFAEGQAVVLGNSVEGKRWCWEIVYRIRP